MNEPTYKEIADWFLNESIWSKIQTPDGFNYTKDSDGGYVYVWVMSSVDLDLEKHYLLDVRIHHADAKWEIRSFLYIHLNVWDNSIINIELVGAPISFDASPEDHNLRLMVGLMKFVQLATNNHSRDRDVN